MLYRMFRWLFRKRLIDASNRDYDQGYRTGVEDGASHVVVGEVVFRPE